MRLDGMYILCAMDGNRAFTRILWYLWHTCMWPWNPSFVNIQWWMFYWTIVQQWLAIIHCKVWFPFLLIFCDALICFNIYLKFGYGLALRETTEVRTSGFLESHIDLGTVTFRLIYLYLPPSETLRSYSEDVAFVAPMYNSILTSFVLYSVTDIGAYTTWCIVQQNTGRGLDVIELNVKRIFGPFSMWSRMVEPTCAALICFLHVVHSLYRLCVRFELKSTSNTFTWMCRERDIAYHGVFSSLIYWYIWSGVIIVDPVSCR